MHLYQIFLRDRVFAREVRQALLVGNSLNELLEKLVLLLLILGNTYQKKALERFEIGCA